MDYERTLVNALIVQKRHLDILCWIPFYLVYLKIVPVVSVKRKESMMTNNKTDHNKPVESIELNKEPAMNSESMARRKALAALAKHAVYTAPAVLAILSVTTNRAKAGYF